MRRKFLSVLLVAAMTTTLFGCGDNSNDKKDNKGGSTTSKTDTNDTTGGDEEDKTPENQITGDASAEDAFVIWGWNDDVKKILDGPFKEDYADEYSRIVFVNTGGSDYYQGKIDEILKDQSNEIYPDIMALEVDYVKKYTNGENLLSIDDLGISSDDTANMYQYNLDLGSDNSGTVKALFWQATPGCFAIRADLAEKYLGTTDPDELQDKYFSSYDKIVEAAKTVSEASDGNCKILGGFDELKRPLMNSRKNGFYDENDNITIDENINTYFDLVKTLGGEDLTFNTAQWSADWYGVMGGDGEASKATLSYFGCPWFIYWCLKGNDDNPTEAWVGNTILVPGPAQCFWGGSGLAATTGCADKDLAATIIKAFTCDADFMVKINALNSDYVNSSVAVENIIASGASADGNGMLYADSKQNFIEFFKPLADNIDASTVTAEDQDILSALDSQANEVAGGNKDIDTALGDFKAAVHDTYNYLNIVD